MNTPRMMGRLATTVALTAVLVGVSAGTATAASRPGPLMAPNSFAAYTYAGGATLAEAEYNAEAQFDSNFYGCEHSYTLVSSRQEPDGSWFVRMETTCSGYV